MAKKNCDAAWCPECHAEMAKCDEEFCCLGCGASLIPLFGTAEQRKLTADAIAVELAGSGSVSNGAIRAHGAA